MKLIFSAVSETGNNEKVEVLCNEAELKFYINEKEIIIKDNRNAIEINARNFVNEGASSICYQERPFFKYFKSDVLGNETLEDIIRILGVISPFLHFDGMKITTDQSRRESIEKYLIGWLGIDWTGAMEVQPQFYFLSKELNENSKKDLNFLYQNRFLHKLEIELDINLSLFYLPIHYPDPDYFSFRGYGRTWKRIVKEVNQAILRLTHGKVEQ